MPMSEQTEAYLDACKKTEQAFATLTRLAQIVIDVGKTLEYHPQELGFSNIPEPMPGNARFKLLADSTKWPPAIDLHRALVACHVALAAETTAWNHVPQGDRTGLQPPGHPWGSVYQHGSRTLSLLRV